jgi:hypothetical protein
MSAKDRHKPAGSAGVTDVLGPVGSAQIGFLNFPDLKLTGQHQEAQPSQGQPAWCYQDGSGLRGDHGGEDRVPDLAEDAVGDQARGIPRVDADPQELPIAD